MLEKKHIVNQKYAFIEQNTIFTQSLWNSVKLRYTSFRPRLGKNVDLKKAYLCENESLNWAFPVCIYIFLLLYFSGSKEVIFGNFRVWLLGGIKFRRWIERYKLARKPKERWRITRFLYFRPQIKFCGWAYISL